MSGEKIVEFEVLSVDKRGNIIQLQTKKAEYFTQDLGNGVTLDMVAIRGGKFLMGSPTEEEGSFDCERPQHEVTIQPFWMSKFPVTQALWRAIAELPKVDRHLNLEPSSFQGDNLPVESVSWYDAVEFCSRLSRETGRSYRLPSEAEWEYAARAGTTTPFHCGETIETKLANYRGSATYANEPQGEYRGETTPVGSFPPNAFGLYDMHGNVWEWCADIWHDNYSGAPSNGSAWIIGGKDNCSSLRGGSWYDYPEYCRCAYRDFLDRSKHVKIVYIVGLRVLCDFDPR